MAILLGWAASAAAPSSRHDPRLSLRQDGGGGQPVLQHRYFSSLFEVALWGETLPSTSLIAIAVIIASGVMVSVASRKPAPAMDSD